MQESLWVLDLNTKMQGFLSIPNAIMETICRLLPTQADRYEACLIHPTWQTAAMVALWESPEFPTQDSFRKFVNRVRQHKRSALAVRHLNLCITRERYPCKFEWSVSDELRWHASYRDVLLAKPQVIETLLRQCEKLESLSIYGWQLELEHLQKLAGCLPELRELRILGSACDSTTEKIPQLPTVMFNNVIPRLTKLQLDAVFVYPSQQLSILRTRCTTLKSLRLSLAGMSQESFEALCSPSCIYLEELTLAHARHLRDFHVERAITSFTHLRKLYLEDVVHVTMNGIIAALRECPLLEELAIRASPTREINGDNHSNSNSDDNDARDNYQQNERLPHLRRFQLQNMPVNDDEFGRLLFHSDKLISVSLIGCQNLTNLSMANLCDAAPFLLALEVIDCKGIGGQTVKSLAYCTAVRSLEYVTIGGCDEIKPMELYTFIRSAVNHRLKSVSIAGYSSIMNSFIGRYRTADNRSDAFRLSRADMLSLVGSGPVPQSRYLTSEQVVRLASKLQLSVLRLEMILDEIQV